MVKKRKITFPLASAKPIMYCQLTLVLSLFSFLFALKKYKQKKTCFAPTTKELICNRSHLISFNLTGFPINAQSNTICFFELNYFQRLKKQIEFAFLQHIKPVRYYLISGLPAAKHNCKFANVATPLTMKDWNIFFIYKYLIQKLKKIFFNFV
ncbi:MAG TPA: hypothetical protein DEH02_08600 [Bacteroidales bacterium]|nr:MAG: hypothetical protein A2X01_12260 [Bacteroidetes bacterium GWF2_35_48]HBX51109.1 hypothetical protein [Bacteroidales bacterium]